MTELASASLRLSRDLFAAGVDPGAAAHARDAYERALAGESDDAWTGFYVTIFAALETIATPPAAGADARRRLSALLEDDLGAAMLADDQRERLRSRLVEAA